MTNPEPASPPSDELYIGYAPPMPPHIARFVKRAVLTIAAGVPIAASLIAIGHVRLDGGTFDYGQPRRIAGVITTRPYPSIHVDVDGDGGGEQAGRNPWALLVAPGKHGAERIVAPFDGQRVTLEATRIQRGGAVMFEVTPGAIAASPTSGSLPAAGSPREGSAVTLRGEIVDGKCFLGVMVPGEGKTHKDCASLCLRGGIPPAFVVRDREGRTALMLLVSESGGSLAGHDAVVKLAGEPIEVTGVIEEEITPSGARAPGWRMLRTNPSTWRPLGTPAR